MPDSWMSSNVYYRKTAAHPTHHTNARFMDIGCQVMYSIHQKNCCTPNPSHQCQIHGCQAMYATDNWKTAAHPQPVAPKLDPWMDVKWCILQNKTKNAAHPTCRNSHQCQIPGCQPTYSISTETPLRTQPVTPCTSTCSSRPWPCAYRPSPLLHTPIRCTNAWFMDASNVFYRIRKNRNQCQNPRWMSRSDVFCKNRIFFSATRDLSYLLNTVPCNLYLWLSLLYSGKG